MGEVVKLGVVDILVDGDCELVGSSIGIVDDEEEITGVVAVEGVSVGKVVGEVVVDGVVLDKVLDVVNGASVKAPLDESWP